MQDEITRVLERLREYPELLQYVHDIQDDEQVTSALTTALRFASETGRGPEEMVHAVFAFTPKHDRAACRLCQENPVAADATKKMLAVARECDKCGAPLWRLQDSTTGEWLLVDSETEQRGVMKTWPQVKLEDVYRLHTCAAKP